MGKLQQKRYTESYGIRIYCIYGNYEKKIYLVSQLKALWHEEVKCVH
jgi:hypothetical protein